MRTQKYLIKILAFEEPNIIKKKISLTLTSPVDFYTTNIVKI